MPEKMKASSGRSKIMAPGFLRWEWPHRITENHFLIKSTIRESIWLCQALEWKALSGRKNWLLDSLLLQCLQWQLFIMVSRRKDFKHLRHIAEKERL